MASQTVLHRLNSASASIKIALGFALLPMLVAPEASTANDSQMITIWRVAPTTFHDKNFDQDRLENLINYSPNRVVTVKKGETLSEILKREYNISQAWTPAVYNKVLQAVQEKNSIEAPSMLPLGEILLPDIPYTSKKYPGENNSHYPQPQLSVGKEGMTWNTTLGAFDGKPIIDNYNRTAARSEIQIRQIPLSELGNISIADSMTSGEELENSSEYQVLSMPVEVHLGSEAHDSFKGLFLEEPERNLLSANLSRPAVTKPILLVLDDSWPDNNEAIRAMRFVAMAAKKIRSELTIANPKHDRLTDINLLEKITFTTFCDGCEYPELRLHSGMIKRSIHEMTSLDLSRHVDVIYLPINTAQSGSQFALREIIYTSLLARSIGPALSKNNTTPASETSHNLAIAESDRIVRRADLAAPLKEASDQKLTIRTDKAILESTIDFISLYAWASNRPFFVSLSWTIPNFKYPTYFRPNSYGLVMAAAGNDSGQNIHANLIQYAARSMSPGDIVAVQNSANSTYLCSSNTFTALKDIPVFGFGFPGRVNEKVCGTSFSTPRLAWFVAAREAVDGTPPANEEERNAWSTRQKSKLMRLQNLEKEGAQRYFINPMKLLEEYP